MRIQQGDPHLRLAGMAVAQDPDANARAEGISTQMHLQEFLRRAREAGLPEIPEDRLRGWFSRGFDIYVTRLRQLGAAGLPPDGEAFRTAERDARELSHVFVNAILALNGWAAVMEYDKFERADIAGEVAASWKRLSGCAGGELGFALEDGRLIATGPQPG